MREKKILDVEIERVVKKLGDLDPTSQEYKDVVDNLKVLTEVKGKPRVDLNNVGTNLTTLIGMSMIMGWERMHVIATKAFTWVARAKL